MDHTQNKFHFPPPELLTKFKIPTKTQAILFKIREFIQVKGQPYKNLDWSTNKWCINVKENQRNGKMMMLFRIHFHCCHQRARLSFKSTDGQLFVVDESQTHTLHVHSGHQRQIKRRPNVIRQNITLNFVEQGNSSLVKRLVDQQGANNNMDIKKKKDQQWNQDQQVEKKLHHKINHIKRKKLINQHQIKKLHHKKKMSQSINVVRKKRPYKRRAQQIIQNAQLIDNPDEPVPLQNKVKRVYKTRFIQKRNTTNPREFKTIRKPVIQQDDQLKPKRKYIRTKPYVYYQRKKRSKRDINLPINRRKKQKIQKQNLEVINDNKIIEQKKTDKINEVAVNNKIIVQNEIVKQVIKQKQNDKQIKQVIIDKHSLKKEYILDPLPMQDNLQMLQSQMSRSNGGEINVIGIMDSQQRINVLKNKKNIVNEDMNEDIIDDDELQNYKQQNINACMIIQWMNMFSLQMSHRLQYSNGDMNLRQIRSKLMRQQQFKNKYVIYRSQKSRLLWNQCIDLLLTHNNIQIIDIDNNVSGLNINNNLLVNNNNLLVDNNLLVNNNNLLLNDNKIVNNNNNNVLNNNILTNNNILNNINNEKNVNNELDDNNQNSSDQNINDNNEQINKQFPLINRIFISRSNKQWLNAQQMQFNNINKYNQQYINQQKQSNQVIYLSIYPIKLNTYNQKSINIIIAYYLIQNIQPSLLWFSFYQNQQAQSPSPTNKLLINNKSINKSTLQYFLKHQSQSKHLSNIIHKSIQYLSPIKNITFIYTTLNTHLINALLSVQNKLLNQKSNTQIHFSIHIQCFQSFINTQFCNKNTHFLSQMSSKISISPHQQQIQKAYHYLYQNSFGFNQENISINPRLIFQNFNFFKQVLSSSSYQTQQDYYLTFLSSNLFHELNNSPNKDFVPHISQMFNKINSFTDSAQLITFVLTLFHRNSQFYNSLGGQISPINLYWIEKQLIVYKKAFSKFIDADVQSQFNSLMFNPKYEFNLVVQSCSRIIISCIYRLMNISKSIKCIPFLSNQKKTILNQQTYFITEDAITSQKYKVIFIEKQQLTKNSTLINDNYMGKSYYPKDAINNEKNYEVKGRYKKWYCECGFSNLTGIPCEHEICCILTAEDSLYNQIIKK